MKFVATLLVSVLFAVAVSAADEATYDTKYDNIDVDQFLTNDRLFENAYKCLMETGRCTPEVNALKTILPDALQTKCKKCSDKQKEKARKVIKYVQENKADKWEKLQAKYDPEGLYKKQFADQLN